MTSESNKLKHKYDFEMDEKGAYFSDLFEFRQFLGKGAFGDVIHCVRQKPFPQDVAVKVIVKPLLPYQEKSLLPTLRKEGETLAAMNHPHVVSSKEVYESEKYIFIVMEFLSGGTLQSFIQSIKEGKAVSENDCAVIMKAILQGLDYIHANNIIHRDLKPDNILFAQKGELTSLKLIDFGLSIHNVELISHYQTEDDDHLGGVGTILYMAPEMVRGTRYSKEIDVFSAGIILYNLLTKGGHPFYEQGVTKALFLRKMRNLTSADLSTIRENPLLSSNARHLILKMLDPSPSERYSTSQILTHPWILRRNSAELPQTIADVIKNFTNKQELLNLIKGVMFLKYIESISVPPERVSPPRRSTVTLQISQANSISPIRLSYRQSAAPGPAPQQQRNNSTGGGGNGKDSVNEEGTEELEVLSSGRKRHEKSHSFHLSREQMQKPLDFRRTVTVQNHGNPTGLPDDNGSPNNNTNSPINYTHHSGRGAGGVNKGSGLPPPSGGSKNMQARNRPPPKIPLNPPPLYYFPQKVRSTYVTPLEAAEKNSSNNGQNTHTGPSRGVDDISDFGNNSPDEESKSPSPLRRTSPTVPVHNDRTDYSSRLPALKLVAVKQQPGKKTSEDRTTSDSPLGKTATVFVYPNPKLIPGNTNNRGRKSSGPVKKGSDATERDLSGNDSKHENLKTTGYGGFVGSGSVIGHARAQSLDGQQKRQRSGTSQQREQSRKLLGATGNPVNPSNTVIAKFRIHNVKIKADK